MFQLVEAFFDTTFRLGGQYGPPIALGVVALVGCGVVLKLVSWVVSQGGSKEG